MKDNIDIAVQKTVDYLYTIKGECSPELYTAINRLRQLINEEFVGKNKLVSSQLIFDILEQAIQQELLKAKLEELENVLSQDMFKNPDPTVGQKILNLVIKDRIADLQAKLKENSDG